MHVRVLAPFGPGDRRCKDLTEPPGTPLDPPDCAVLHVLWEEGAEQDEIAGLEEEKIELFQRCRMGSTCACGVNVQVFLE